MDAERVRYLMVSRLGIGLTDIVMVLIMIIIKKTLLIQGTDSIL